MSKLHSEFQGMINADQIWRVPPNVNRHQPLLIKRSKGDNNTENTGQRSCKIPASHNQQYVKQITTLRHAG